ncbi:MAG: DUF4179 domain-containing protein [Firmicutes bacterium]|nr:DUF4179 domain-containing protein [Bacillota bacterium]
MRNTEERVLAVKLRAKEIEDQKRIHRGRILCISSFAACLLFLVGISFVMPGVMGSMTDDGYTNFGTAASIFDGSNYFGFILIGFLAFALGVSVTILSYKIKQINYLYQEDKEDKDD